VLTSSRSARQLDDPWAGFALTSCLDLKPFEHSTSWGVYQWTKLVTIRVSSLEICLPVLDERGRRL